jgi:glutaredoxin 3
MSDEPEFAPPSAFTEPVVIYTTRWCGYCMMALRLLRARAFTFVQVPVDGNADARAWLVEHTGRTTVPQVFIGGRSVGGFDDIAELDERGELAGLVAAAQTP